MPRSGVLLLILALLLVLLGACEYRRPLHEVEGTSPARGEPTTPAAARRTTAVSEPLFYGCTPEAWPRERVGQTRLSYEHSATSGRRFELAPQDSAGLERAFLGELAALERETGQTEAEIRALAGETGSVLWVGLVLPAADARVTAEYEALALFTIDGQLYRLRGRSPGGEETGFGDLHRVVALCLERALSRAR